jgi:hypothetical protein
MATSTFTVTLTDPTLGTLTKTFTFQATDITNIIAAFQQAANVSVNGTATPQQVHTYMWTALVNEALVTVKSYQYQAAVGAVAQPAPITYT